MVHLILIRFTYSMGTIYFFHQNLRLPKYFSRSSNCLERNISLGTYLISRGFIKLLAIKNAQIFTITHGIIEKGTVLINNGKIVEVGEQVNIPVGFTVIDAKGSVLTPGLIDVHTHLGVYEEIIGKAGADGNELTDPVTSHVRALDAINPADRGFRDAYEGGITCAQVMPGSGNVIGGEMVIVKTFGRVVEEMVVKSPSGLKIAFGENPKRVYGDKGKMPSSRMGTAAVLREAFVKAQNYMRKIEQADGDETKLPDRDLKLEIIVKALKREVQVRAHAHRADDIMTALRMAEEFNLDMTIEHCTEGHKIADILAEKGIRAAVGPTMSNRSKIELGDKGFHTVVELTKAGVPISITTDHPVVPIETLTIAAAVAVREGLNEQQALEAITINAARHMDVEDRIGSIEAGKDADVVLWTGHPFDYKSKVNLTVIDGKIVFER
jgi:imidazolonepropionase-like amidohydrolase